MTEGMEHLRQNEDTKVQLAALRAQVENELKQQAALEQSRNAGNDR